MPSVVMTQNVYDQPEFFQAYSQLRRSVEGLDGAAEWPAVRALLPDMHGLKVVDLGCGFGWFCRWARAQGAAQVLGIDVSEKMLARARAATPEDGIAYEQGDLETLDLPEEGFDLVYSSLAFHYVEDAGRLFAQIRRALPAGGRLVFSTEHPIYMAPTNPRWAVDEDGGKTWPLNRYLVQGARTTDWLAKGVVKHHRTLGTTLNLLIRSGFRIEHVEEFCPTPEQIAERPELADELERPMFLIVRASVPSEGRQDRYSNSTR
jgi:SAM-dependent methyltransferase